MMGLQTYSSNQEYLDGAKQIINSIKGQSSRGKVLVKLLSICYQ